MPGIFIDSQVNVLRLQIRCAHCLQKNDTVPHHLILLGRNISSDLGPNGCWAKGTCLHRHFDQIRTRVQHMGTTWEQGFFLGVFGCPTTVWQHFFELAHVGTKSAIRLWVVCQQIQCWRSAPKLDEADGIASIRGIILAGRNCTSRSWGCSITLSSKSLHPKYPSKSLKIISQFVCTNKLRDTDFCRLLLWTAGGSQEEFPSRPAAEHSCGFCRLRSMETFMADPNVNQWHP